MLGLKYFHSIETSYRNLNLQNVFVGSDNYVCLADYGMTRLMKLRENNLTDFYGTPYYLAPEVIKGER